MAETKTDYEDIRERLKVLENEYALNRSLYFHLRSRLDEVADTQSELAWQTSTGLDYKKTRTRRVVPIRIYGSGESLDFESRF